jgi:hypothetical protein
MNSNKLDRRQRWATWTAGAAWVLLVGTSCATEPAAEGELEGTMQPGQTVQPVAGTPAATGGNKAPTTGGAGGGAKAGSGGSPGTTTGTAGTRAATGGAGAAGTAATAGTGGSSTAGASGAAASAGSSGSAGAAGSAGTAATAGSGGAAGSSGTAATAGTSGSAAGSGGTTTAGTGGSAGAAGGSATEREDLGEGDATDVVLIGDSWMDNTLQFEGTGGGIAPSLIRESGQRYRNYGVQGVELLAANTFGAAIPTQWDAAKRADPDIKTVVMTAGGNDVIQGSSTLQSSCLMGTDECKMKLKVISDALDKLWTQMADDGVLDIVHIRYTDNTGTLHPDLQADKGLPRPKICDSGRVRCHAVHTTDIVARGDLAIDGIHPLGSANDKIAKRVYELMVKEGMRR